MNIVAFLSPSFLIQSVTTSFTTTINSKTKHGLSNSPKNKMAGKSSPLRIAIWERNSGLVYGICMRTS